MGVGGVNATGTSQKILWDYFSYDTPLTKQEEREAPLVTPYRMSP